MFVDFLPAARLLFTTCCGMETARARRVEEGEAWAEPGMGADGQSLGEIASAAMASGPGCF